MHGRRVMVTGGAGFIGAHLVVRLLRDGARVAVVDDFSTGTRPALRPAFAAGLRDGDVFTADIGTGDGARAVEDWAPHTLIHLAAQSRVAASVTDPVRDAQTNIVGTVSLLAAAARHGVRRVVYASSGGTVYGDRTGATAETQPHAPISPYGLSKSTAEQYLRLYHDLFGLAYTSLALGNVYGPGQDGGSGCGVIGRFVADLLAGRTPTVTGDGAQTRDFVHVDDVVEAFMLACRYPGNRVINIGSGVETSVDEALRLVCDCLGVPVARRRRPAPPGEVRRNRLDPALARRVLRWQPRVPLEQGVRDLVAAMLADTAHPLPLP